MIGNLRELQPATRRSGLLSQRRSWMPLPLATNWSAYATTEQAPEFSVRDGEIRLRGMVKKTVAVVADEKIGTLPVASRPRFASTCMASCSGGRSPIGVQVKPNGEVWVLKDGQTAYGAGYDPGTYTILDGVVAWLG